MKRVTLAFVATVVLASAGCASVESKIEDCAEKFVPYDRTSEAVAGCLQIYRPGQRRPRSAPSEPSLSGDNAA